MNIFYLHESPAFAAEMHCDQHVRKMLIESAQLLSTAHRVLDGTERKLEVKLTVGANVNPPTIGGKIPLYNKTRKVKLLDGENAHLKSIRYGMVDDKWVRVPDLGEPVPRRLFKHMLPDGRFNFTKWEWQVDLVVEGKLCCIDTHENHPSAIWTRERDENYLWLFKLYKMLNAEFNYRWGKGHACWLNWNAFLEHPPKNIPNSPFVPPPQAMPDEFKDPDTVEAYRKFYNGDKSSFATWTKRNPPKWYNP